MTKNESLGDIIEHLKEIKEQIGYKTLSIKIFEDESGVVSSGFGSRAIILFEFNDFEDLDVKHQDYRKANNIVDEEGD